MASPPTLLEGCSVFAQLDEKKQKVLSLVRALGFRPAGSHLVSDNVSDGLEYVKHHIADYEPFFTKTTLGRLVDPKARETSRVKHIVRELLHGAVDVRKHQKRDGKRMLVTRSYHVYC